MHAPSVEPAPFTQADPLSGRLARAILAGFVASLAMLLLFLVAYNVARLLSYAPLLAAPWAEQPRQWLDNLTHNRLIDAGLADVYIATAVYFLGGLFWAVAYSFVEPRIPGPAWARGVWFAMIPCLLSLAVVLPLLGGGPFGFGLGAGPLPIVGNLLLHAAYGAIMGLVYGPLGELDATTLERRAPGDRRLAPRYHEGKAAVLLVVGLVLGALGGGALAFLLDPGAVQRIAGEPTLALILWGGLLGGAAGVLIGSFLGLTDPSDRRGKVGGPTSLGCGSLWPAGRPARATSMLWRGPSMRYTTFGRTGLNVSRLSMGCNRLGDPGEDPAQWPPIVQRALERGVNFFDTSNSYNQGRSEAILGEVTARWPEPTVIATKGGVPVDTNDYPNRDFSAETITAAVEDSLKRLKRDTIDLYMLHSPSVQQLETQTWPEAIEKLKAQGKIRFFGISTHDHASGVWAINHGADFLQIEYHLIDTTAEEELLPLARQHDVGIMVRVPLARGLLSGKFRAGEAIPPEQQWRRPTGDQLQLRLARVEQLRFLEREGQTLAQASLRWLLAQPGVHCVIPGARTVEQLDANIGAIDGDLTAEEQERIRALQDRWRAEGRW